MERGKLSENVPRFHYCFIAHNSALLITQMLATSSRVWGTWKSYSNIHSQSYDIYISPNSFCDLHHTYPHCLSLPARFCSQVCPLVFTL